MNDTGYGARHDNYSDGYIREILSNVKSVAIVGASANEVRPSFFVAKYLIAKGFQIYPINPGHAGREIAGAMTYESLSALPVDVEMVDIFRRKEHLPKVVEEIKAMAVLPKVVWFQLGIRDDEVAVSLEALGIKVVQNRCPKIEYARLCGEIGWAGFNRRTISARKPTLQKGFQHFGLESESTV